MLVVLGSVEVGVKKAVDGEKGILRIVGRARWGRERRSEGRFF